MVTKRKNADYFINDCSNDCDYLLGWVVLHKLHSFQVLEHCFKSLILEHKQSLLHEEVTECLKELLDKFCVFEKLKVAVGNSF